ncbi:hypothetical protein CLAIMM_14721 isoform 2 [Cladophialophora immunda]|nr:hypothetical protein CLAIMM_14721 isoform 2 [Cladophialophora immunda]
MQRNKRLVAQVDLGFPHKSCQAVALGYPPLNDTGTRSSKIKMDGSTRSGRVFEEGTFVNTLAEWLGNAALASSRSDRNASSGEGNMLASCSDGRPGNTWISPLLSLQAWNNTHPVCLPRNRPRPASFSTLSLIGTVAVAMAFHSQSSDWPL